MSGPADPSSLGVVADLRRDLDALRGQVAHHRDRARGAHGRACRRVGAIVERLLAEYQASNRAEHSALTDGAVQALGRLRDELARAAADAEG